MPYPASKRDKMMFAQAKNVDISDDHHLVVVFGKDSIVDDL